MRKCSAFFCFAPITELIELTAGVGGGGAGGGGGGRGGGDAVVGAVMGATAL